MTRKSTTYRTEFVEFIPKELESGTLYISVKNNTAVHLCACGCGTEIVTPLDRNAGWIMEYDGQSVSLSPSVGNGRYKCQSHYYLRDGHVNWLPNINDSYIEQTQLKTSWFSKLLSFINRNRK